MSKSVVLKKKENRWTARVTWECTGAGIKVAAGPKELVDLDEPYRENRREVFRE